MPPTSQFNFVGFSHGANVAHVASRWLINRVPDHFVQIAMPHNYDIREWQVRQYPRHCSVFSWSDWVVRDGSSPYQQANYWYTIGLESYYNFLASEAIFNEDWAGSYYYQQVRSMYAAIAWQWWMDFRIDPVAYNVPAGHYAHTDMHYAWMFTDLPSQCKTN